jgi:hypothetical protein
MQLSKFARAAGPWQTGLLLSLMSASDPERTSDQGECPKFPEVSQSETQNHLDYPGAEESTSILTARPVASIGEENAGCAPALERSAA